MPIDAVAVRNWMRRSPRDWNGSCQAFVWNITKDLGIGGPSSYSAYIAGDRSAPLNPSHPRNAPKGAYVYWGGVWSQKDKMYYGHVGIHMGDGVIAMGSSLVTDEPGINVGFIQYDTYQAKARLPYRGWSMTNNGGRFPMEASPTPLPNTQNGGLSVADANEIMAYLKGTVVQNQNNIGAHLTRLGNSINEEGRDSRVYFNKASGIYALGHLGYWHELGANINLPTMSETWAAREKWGLETLGHYRRYGLAQEYTFKLESAEWDFARMLCLNPGASPESRQLQELSAGVIEKAIREELQKQNISVNIDVAAIANASADVIAARLAGTAK
jgi:hypothetical protein